MSFSAISSLIFCNNALVSGEEIPLDLDGGGSVEGMVDEDCVVDEWCGGGGEE